MNPTAAQKSSTSLSSEQIHLWFEQLISHIKVDKLMIETETADQEKFKFYQDAISGNHTEIFKSIRFNASQALIKDVVFNFLSEIKKRNALPIKLAFSLTPATILVWAEIADNDENLEDQLLLAESKVNAYAKQFDFSLDTMIVEKSDNLPVPTHYTVVPMI